MDQSPDAWSASAALVGGQFTAHGPLQVLLPLPAASLSNVYSVMPAELTSVPPSNFAAIGAPPMLAQAPSTVVSTIAASIFIMPFSCWIRVVGLLRMVKQPGSRVYSCVGKIQPETARWSGDRNRWYYAGVANSWLDGHILAA